MALMKFREPNQVKWIGVRPGHNGTQTAKYAVAVNQTTILHTVTAGKTLCLVTGSLYTQNSMLGLGQLYIRNDADAFWFSLCGIFGATLGGYPGQSWHSYPPLEVPAGYDIIVTSSVAGFTVYGSISGWEE